MYDKLKTLIEPIWIKRNNIMLLGDFNIDLLSKGNNTEDSEEPPYRFRRLLNMFNMKNVIKKPTRISGNTKTFIDLIITSDTSKIKYSGTYDSGCSDHHLVYAVTNLRKERPKPKLKAIRNYKSVDLNKLREDFEYAPWQICRLFYDVDDTAWAWECVYKDIVESHITTRKAKIRSESAP